MFLPILHGSANGSFITAWNFEPLLTLMLLASGIGYAWALKTVGRRGRKPAEGWRVLAFYAGLASVAVALLGPLDTFNDELFMLHMLQHLVLTLVAAPLLLLGRPVQLALRALPPRYAGRVVRPIARRRPTRGMLTIAAMPLIAIGLYNGTTIVWHMPALYVAALESDIVHWVMHVTFFGTALLFWWGVIDPVPRHHKWNTVWILVGIGASMAVGKVVGGILAFAERVVYSYYETAERPWGLSALADQQAAGTIMLVVGGLFYTVIGLIVVTRAFMNAESDQESREHAVREAQATAPIR